VSGAGERPRFRLRPAGPPDLERAWTIYAEAMRPLAEALMPWTEPAQRRVVEAALAEGAEVIEMDGLEGRMAGWLQVRRMPEGLFLAHLYLAPEARGRGIGSALLRALLGRACREGGIVALEAMTNNPARALYRRLGFVETGALRHKVRMEWRPARPAGQASTPPPARV
jgi:ribosomal protein S18 acetylase RimI-like enzyme